MKIALHQAKRIMMALVLALVGGALAAPSAAHAEVWVTKDANGVFRFSRTPVPGAKPLSASLGGEDAPSSEAYDHLIVDMAERYGVDAALVKAIIHAESTFQPRARSRAGALGLMQLMPRTAGVYGVRGHELYEPGSNIRAGVRHLRSLLETFAGNVRLAVAAYNAGAGAVHRHRGLPPFRETQDYVQKVLRLRARYGTLSARG